MSSTLTINSNVPSLKTQRRLTDRTRALQSSFERLSSGLRINRAGDDAAGLSIVSALNVDGRVYAQASRNASDAISLYSIAEGALTELVSIATRLRELAEQSANGTLGAVQRQALDTEAQALSLEYRRIVWATEFNGKALFDNTSRTLNIQAGYSTLGLTGGTASTGTFAAPRTIAASWVTQIELVDLNGDGLEDMVDTQYWTNVARVSFGNGDGTFRIGGSFTLPANGSNDLFVGDLNGDGRSDIAVVSNGNASVLLGNGDGTFRAVKQYGPNDAGHLIVGDVNGDSAYDLITTDYSNNRLSVMLGNGNGTFRGPQAAITIARPMGGIVEDFNGDGKLDLAIASNTATGVHLAFGNGDGTFAAPKSFAMRGSAAAGMLFLDVNGDLKKDIVALDTDFASIDVLLGNGNGDFKARIEYAAGSYGTDSPLVAADINEDGNADLITAYGPGSVLRILNGNSDGTFQAAREYAAGQYTNKIVAVDINNDQRLDLLTADTNSSQVGIYFGNGEQTAAYAPGVGVFTLRTQDGARKALMQFGDAIDRLTGSLGWLGANQSRLQSVVSVMQQNRESYMQAASRIEDVDVADEAARLTAARIIQEAGAAILAQANQQPAIALQLLGGA